MSIFCQRMHFWSISWSASFFTTAFSCGGRQWFSFDQWLTDGFPGLGSERAASILNPVGWSSQWRLLMVVCLELPNRPQRTRPIAARCFNLIAVWSLSIDRWFLRCHEGPSRVNELVRFCQRPEFHFILRPFHWKNNLCCPFYSSPKLFEYKSISKVCDWSGRGAQYPTLTRLSWAFSLSSDLDFQCK